MQNFAELACRRRLEQRHYGRYSAISCNDLHMFNNYAKLFSSDAWLECPLPPLVNPGETMHLFERLCGYLTSLHPCICHSALHLVDYKNWPHTAMETLPLLNWFTYKMSATCATQYWKMFSLHFQQKQPHSMRDYFL